MKNLFQTLLIIAVGGWLAQTARGAEDDPVKLAPRMYRVLLDNHQVRVLDVRLRPGQKTPMHSHPDYIIYALEGGTARFFDEKGKATTMHVRPGKCVWREDETHAVQNIGKHTIHVLNIEVKGVRMF
ncbi:MAG: cytoplasmic protein [Verrucomicrobiota bacterium]